MPSVGVFIITMSKEKLRILMCAESSHIKSGFGNYTKEILSRLHATGKYQIAELSCYRTPETPKIEPWKIYPVGVATNDPLFAEYSSNDANPFGQWRFEFALLDFKPHVVFDIRDFWNYIFQGTSPLRPYYHWLIVPTYDSTPQKIESVNVFYNADTLCFHTHWAKENLITHYNYHGKNIGPIMNDAVDSSVFKPIDHSKRFHKHKYNIPQDAFVIGSVMRNQKRKLIPDICKIFAKILKKNPQKNIFLYLHTSYPDGQCWDIPALLLEHNIANNVIFTYKCHSCSKCFNSTFKGSRIVCQGCMNPNVQMASVSNGTTDAELNEIYNLFDIYLQYAICEGFGIPPAEAASAGIPVVTVNHEAMGEVGGKVGANMVDIKTLFREQETNADRCLPNHDICLDVLQNMIDMPISELVTLGRKTRKLLMSNYSWDATAKKYEEVFDNIDISQKLDWNGPKRSYDPHFTLNGQLGNRQFIYSLIDNIIQDPKLKSTNFIEELIKSLDDGAVQNGQKVFPFTKQSAIKILEAYVNNLSALETLRTTPSPLPEKLKSFIEYSKK